MANSCIICGGPAGSGEHVFPAALGGRRINRQIYCTSHDNGYSSLVGVLASQLDLFNSLLGVRPDHGNDVKKVSAIDKQSGRVIEMSTKGIKLAEPWMYSQEPVADGAMIQMRFPDHESKNKWIKEQEAKGTQIKIINEGTRGTYFLDTVHFSRQFGGPYGLGAVAYVTQTFFAQEFPDIARSSAMDEFKKYTQTLALSAQKPESSANIGKSEPPVWWDFDPQPDETPNTFEFGHRVTLGVDASDGLIYGRISFFSTLHFSMIFGTAVDTVDTKSITIDIDPLADHPPNDIQKRDGTTAVARVYRPLSQTSGLSDAISSGESERMVTDLLRRLSEFDLKRTAEAMYEELKDAGNLTPIECHALFTSVIDQRLQRIWNLVRYVITGFKVTLADEVAAHLSPMLDTLIAYDSTTSNGISPMSSCSLEIARQAILSQMLEDHQRGSLNAQRLADLMGNGPGAAIIGKAILTPLLNIISADSTLGNKAR